MKLLRWIRDRLNREAHWHAAEYPIGIEPRCRCDHNCCCRR